MKDPNDTLTEDFVRSHSAKFQAIRERAQTDHTLDALYRVWLIATDISHDASPGEMDDALTQIDRIAGRALGVRP